MYMADEKFAREMKITKKETLKKDITGLVIRPRVLQWKAKSKVWDVDRGVDGKFSQPGGNEFLGYPSFFTLPFSFPSLFLFHSKL